MRLLCYLSFLFIIGCDHRVYHYFTNTAPSKDLEWQAIHKTPYHEKGYTPQGLEIIQNLLFISVSHDDKLNTISVFSIDGGKLIKVKELKLPKYAVHSSGLSWDGKYLWIVDYVSKKLYQTSLLNDHIKVEFEYDTNLEGPSAVSVFTYKNTKYLLLTDFMNTGKTYIYNLKSVQDNKQINSNSEVCSYKNPGYSQGLKYIDGNLYEVHNKFGADRIYKLSFGRLLKYCDFNKSILDSVNTPSKMAEDIAFNKNEIWISDESTFTIYKGQLF